MFVAMLSAMLSLVALAVTAPAVPTAKPVALPVTAAGRIAAAWFTAYNTGEAEVKRFVETRVAAEALKRRSLDERLSIYRDMRKENGDITPLRVVDSRERELVLEAISATGDAITMTFAFATDVDDRVDGVRMEMRPAGSGSEPSAGSSSASAAVGMSDAEIAASLHASLDSLERADAFSGAVLLAKSDQVLLREAHGFAVRATKTPNTVDTRFNIGSINKMFTKVAIDQLAAAGKLHYDDTIDRYLPSYPKDKGRKITIQQLLDHRAGTGVMFVPAYVAADRSKLLTVSDWVKLVRDEPLLFEPGTKQEYSNTGYILLGAIVEKVSGQSYYDYGREHVYAPVGMRATDSYARDANVTNRATGYTKQLGGTDWQDNHDRLPGRASPAGGGYSTLDDMYAFANALRAGKLGAASRGDQVMAGGALGINASVAMIGDYTLVVLTNLDPPGGERVTSAVSGWLRGSMPADAADAGHQVNVGGRAMYAEAGAHAGAASEPVRRVVQSGSADDPAHKPKRTVLPKWTVDVPMLHRDHMPAVEVMVNG